MRLRFETRGVTHVTGESQWHKIVEQFAHYIPTFSIFIHLIKIFGPIMDPFIYVYSYMDPLWTHLYTFIHIWTHYGPIHIRLFTYGPIMDPFIYVYAYMDPLWTHSYKCIHIWTHYGPIHTFIHIWTHYEPIMDPLWTHYGPIWTHSYTCIHIWTHYGPIHIRVFIYECCCITNTFVSVLCTLGLCYAYSEYSTSSMS